MIKIDEIKKLLECALCSAYVESNNKDRAVNLLLIAQAESGKSELIQILQDYPNAYYTNDLSFKPFIDEILPEVERDDISHIVIPDFINVISHRRSANILIPALNSFLAEGIKDLKYYGSSRKFSKAITGSIITGLTKPLFDTKIIMWKNNGFLSRVLPVTYSYSETTKIQIHNSIMKGEYSLSERVSKDLTQLKLKSLKIIIPKDIAIRLMDFSQSISQQNFYYATNRKIKLEQYGFRFHKQLRSLLKGICIFNTDKLEVDKDKIYNVTEKDFEDLKNLSKYLNYNFIEV